MVKKKKFSKILFLFAVLGLVIFLSLEALASLGSPENNARIGMGPNSYTGVCEAPGSLCLDFIP